MLLPQGHPHEAVWVDTTTMTVTLADGTRLPITLYDEDGDECEPGDAVFAVAGSDETGWLQFDLPDAPPVLN